MALIKCPECGRENVSSTATACPDCGFDLRGYQQKQDADRAAAEAEKKAQRNLEEKRRADEAAHQRFLDTIPDPTPYGKISTYVIIAIVGLLLCSSSPVFIVLAILAAIAYGYKSHQEYNKFLEAPIAFKEAKAAERAAKASGGIKVEQFSSTNATGTAFCPKCGGEDISRQVFQENKGSKTVTSTTSRYKEQGHGCLWWIFIGSWWWAVDLFLWFFAFLPRLILRLFAAPFKKKRYKGKSTSVSTTENHISYRTICTCNKCGHTWG